MGGPFDQALADLDAPDQQPAGGAAPFAQALADLDAPESTPQYRPVASGMAQSFQNAAVRTGQAIISPLALPEAVVRRFVGPTPTSTDPTPLGAYMRAGERVQQGREAAASYDERPGVSGTLQRSAEGAAGSLPDLALGMGAASGVKAASPVAVEAANELARLIGAAKAAAASTTTRDVMDTPTLEHLPHAIVQGAIEAAMTRLGGTTGAEAVLRKPGEQTVRAATGGVVKEAVKEMPTEGLTALLQGGAQQAEAGKYDPGALEQQSIEGLLSGGMTAGVVNAPSVAVAAAQSVAEQQQAAQAQREAQMRQVAAAFDPVNAQVQVTAGEGPAMGQPMDVPQADGPGPVSITQDVLDAIQADPALGNLSPAQAAEVVDADQQQVADAVVPGAEDAANELGAELSLADEQVRAKQGLERQEAEARRQRELSTIADEALGEKPRDPPPEPPDLAIEAARKTLADAERQRELTRVTDEALGTKPRDSFVEAPDLAAEAAKKTLADQERVQTENRERERRKLAFALREDLGLVGDRLGGHGYDSAGKLQYDERAPNRAARMGKERAQAFVKEVLGDDQGAMAGDDPTASPAAAKFRMEAKPLPPEQSAGVRTSTPPPAPTAAEIIDLPPAKRMEAFRALPPADRARLQPEITRLMQERAHVHGFKEGGAAKPTAPAPAAPTAADIVAMPPAKRMEALSALPPEARAAIQPEISRLMQEQKKAEADRGMIHGFNEGAPKAAEPAPTPVAGSPVAPAASASAAAPADPVVPEMRQAPQAAVFDQIGRTKRIDSAETPKAEADVRQWIGSMPTFQGGKRKMAVSTVAAIDSTMGADAQKVNEVHDLFGGGGSWGLFLALTRFPNAKKLVVREFDADRLAKIQLFHRLGDQFMAVAQRSGALEIARRAYGQVHSDQVAKGKADPSNVRVSAGGLSGRLGNMLSGTSPLTPEQRAVLAALRDYGYASFGSRDFDSLVQLVAGHAAESKRAADAFTARGGTIEHQGGSSYDAQVPAGPGVLAVADPPYYGTASYNDYEGASVVQAPLYAKTADLMERLSSQGNSLVYTDEAWWAKRDKKGDANAPTDWRDGMQSLDRVQRSLDHFDVVAKPIAGRAETLGIINGFRRTNEPRAAAGAVERQPAGADDNGARPVAAGQAGRPAGDAQPRGERGDGVPAVQPVAPRAGGEAAPAAPARAPVAPEPASAAAPSPNQPPAAPPGPGAGAKEIARLARISKAVLPDTVTVTEHGDHVRITYPGGATIQVRPVESLPLDAAAWFDSVAKVKGALSAAFSRAGYGPLMPPKAAFLRMPKAQREAVMAELQPVAAVTDISGRRVGVSREALVRLATPGKRTDAQVADALEEEDHHFLFSGLLSDQERTIVRDELARSRPELAKEDPASRAVMEAAYEHWRTWNQDRQKAAITPKTTGIFRRLAERIRTLLRWFDKTPAVSSKTAAQVWEGLGEARGRADVTPAAKAEDGDSNATLIPRDENLGGAELRKQWQKATGEKPAKTESYQELAKRSDAVDRAKGRQVAYALDIPSWKAPGDPPAPGVSSKAWGSLSEKRKEQLAQRALRDGIEIASSNKKPLKNPSLRWVKVADITPSQSGEDYDNESSRSTVKSLRKMAEGEDHPYGYERDAAPIVVDGNGQIIDGNHRHYAAVENGDEYILAWDGRESETADGDAYSVPQALNEVMPGDQRQTFDQWQEEASAILADPAKLADVRARAQADAGLSPAEQIALRRLVSDQLAEAAQSGNANRWQEALETAALRKAAGSRVARELASRRLDLSTPEGRREAILSYTAEMGSRWQNAYNKATTKRDRAAVVAKWQAQQEKIQTVLKKRFGIDLSDPRVGEIFSDAYSLGRLFDAVADAGGSRFSLGNLVGYYTAGNLLTAASFAVNLTGYPMMGAIAGLKGATQITAKHLMGMKGNRELTSLQGAWAGARAGTAAIGRGLTNGALAFWTGRPQAEKQAKPISDDANDHTRSTSPIKNPFARAATAPFLEANRFVDEMFWTIAYNGALAAGATEARMAGDKRSHREMIENPDADLVERATSFADWMTLRTGNKSRLERGIAAVRSPTALEDIVDNAVPGLGRFAVNPLYFTMPFFSAIARLTVEGAKISPYGMIANVALGAKRGVDAARADDQAGKDKLSAKAINNLAYALGGLALLGLSLVKGEDDDDLVKGSPNTYKSAGERAVREAVDKPRTIGGVDYSRFDPAALPLSLHADMRDAMREVAAGTADLKTLRTLGEKAFNATIERQFLSGISDLFKPQYDENGDPKGVLTKFGENVTGMLAPGRPWLSTARKLTETEKMERPRGDIERVYEDGSPSRNVFGEREKLREDTTGAALASLFVNPKAQASPEGQKWQKRILEINEAIEEAGGKPWFPGNPGRSYTQGGKTVRWTDEQYDRVRELAGTKWLAMLRGAKALDNADLQPEQQLKVIRALRDQANEYASGMVRAGR